MRPCVASTLAASFVLCQLALVVFVFNAHDTDPRRGLLEQPGNETLTAAQFDRLLSTVEELKGTTEAQQATIAQLRQNFTMRNETAALVNESCVDMAAYMARIVSHYTAGGHTDSCGHWHESGFHYVRSLAFSDPCSGLT